MSSTLDINKLDLYAILHVSEEATEKEVQDQQQLLWIIVSTFDMIIISWFFFDTGGHLGIGLSPGH